MLGPTDSTDIIARMRAAFVEGLRATRQAGKASDRALDFDRDLADMRDEEAAEAAADDVMNAMMPIVDRVLDELNAGKYDMTEAADFDKFMGRLISEQRTARVSLSDSPQRARAARHQERPLGRIRMRVA